MSKFEKTLEKIIAQTEKQDNGVRLVFAICGREAVREAYMRNFRKVGLEEFPGTFEQGFQAGKQAMEDLIQLALEKTELDRAQSQKDIAYKYLLGLIDKI